MHADRLKVHFGDESESEKEREIEILTQEITRVRNCLSILVCSVHCPFVQLIKKAENNLKRIASIGNKGTLSVEERVSFWLHRSFLPVIFVESMLQWLSAGVAPFFCSV